MDQLVVMRRLLREARAHEDVVSRLVWHDEVSNLYQFELDETEAWLEATIRGEGVGATYDAMVAHMAVIEKCCTEFKARAEAALKAKGLSH